MLALIGLLTIVVMLALIMTKKLQTLLALIIVPIVGCLVAGFAGLIQLEEGSFSVTTLGDFITKGLQSIAPTGVMFIFAILFFGLMSDAGTFDPIINGILKIVGKSPVKICIGTVILTSVVHLDGSGAATFLIVIPAMLPLYKKMGMRATTLATLTAIGAGIMNMLPWGGPTIRAISAMDSTVGEIFTPMVVPMICGYAMGIIIAVILGKKEAKRIGNVDNIQISLNTGDDLTDEQKALRRPKLFWVNIALIIVAIILLVTSVLPPAVIFMVATALTLLINYPDIATQKKLVDSHAESALMMASMLFAAGSFIGIMTHSGMLTAMAEAIVQLIPVSAGRFIPTLVGILGVPLSLIFDPDSFYYGVLPILSQAVGQMGLDPLMVARAAIAGQMTLGFPISPLTGSTFLLIGLAGVDLGEHQKKTLPWVWLVSIVIVIAALITGAIAF